MMGSFLSLASQKQTPVLSQYIQNFENGKNIDQTISALTIAYIEENRLKNFEKSIEISAKLAVAYYHGNFFQKSIEWADECLRMGTNFTKYDCTITVLFHKSAAYRALSAKLQRQDLTPKLYEMAQQATDLAEKLYNDHNLRIPLLFGKICYHMGASYGDAPIGDKRKAELCYIKAIQSFKQASQNNEAALALFRLGKILLLRKEYEAVQALLKDERLQTSDNTITMHLDLLEAEMHLAMKKIGKAFSCAAIGLGKAVDADMEPDQLRFLNYLNKLLEASCKIYQKSYHAHSLIYNARNTNNSLKYLMHLDYLAVKLNLSCKLINVAYSFASEGFIKASQAGTEADKKRFLNLLGKFSARPDNSI